MISDIPPNYNPSEPCFLYLQCFNKSIKINSNFKMSLRTIVNGSAMRRFIGKPVGIFVLIENVLQNGKGKKIAFKLPFLF